MVQRWFWGEVTSGSGGGAVEGGSGSEVSFVGGLLGGGTGGSGTTWQQNEINQIQCTGRHWPSIC